MFRFTIRELVLLTVIVALALGWSLHAVNSAALKVELSRLQSRYQTVKGIAHDLHGWTIQEQGDQAVHVVWPRTPPPQSGQVAP